MPNPLPTLGFPSKTAAVAAMREDGIRPSIIAKRIGLPSTRHATALLQSNMRRTVHVSRDVIEELGPFAKERGICAARLARLLVHTAVDQGLVNAILDYGEAAEG